MEDCGETLDPEASKSNASYLQGQTLGEQVHTTMERIDIMLDLIGKQGKSKNSHR